MKNKKGKEKIRENPSITTPMRSTPVHITTSPHKHLCASVSPIQKKEQNLPTSENHCEKKVRRPLSTTKNDDPKR